MCFSYSGPIREFIHMRLDYWLVNGAKRQDTRSFAVKFTKGDHQCFDLVEVLQADAWFVKYRPVDFTKPVMVLYTSFLKNQTAEQGSVYLDNFWIGKTPLICKCTIDPLCIYLNLLQILVTGGFKSTENIMVKKRFQRIWIIHCQS